MSTVAVFYRSGLKFWLEPIERKCSFSLNRTFLPPKHHFKIKKAPYFRLKDPIIMHPSWSDQILENMMTPFYALLKTKMFQQSIQIRKSDIRITSAPQYLKYQFILFPHI